jgi:Asp-tRNA(Asn)/Glu-tRNA(Gln) amidotransferase B subunit
LIAEQKVNIKTVKEVVLPNLWSVVAGNFTLSTPEETLMTVMQMGVTQLNDSDAIEAIIDEVLAANAVMVEEFKAGKEKAFNALVGQAMKASKGKANPAQVNELLKKKLS